MRGPLKRKCKTCGESFVPKSEKNVFCSRRCFKKDFYHRQKKLAKIIRYPTFRCPVCWDLIQLDFDPIKKPERSREFHCPLCRVLLINVLDSIVTKDVKID